MGFCQSGKVGTLSRVTTVFWTFLKKGAKVELLSYPLIQKVGEHVTEDQLHDILCEVDVNKNAQVDLGEFLQVSVTSVEYALKKNYLLDYRCSPCVASTVYEAHKALFLWTVYSMMVCGKCTVSLQ